VTNAPANVPPPNAAAARARSPRRILMMIGLAVLIVLLVMRSCAIHESGREKMVHVFNQAIQRDDLAEVQKLENVGTAADMSRARLGEAADALAPLGAVKRVKEVTPKDDPERVHEFDVTFEKGKVHERIELDPQDHIFHFHYDQPQAGG
jgi:predicted ThiF/HesA family dinucleotide-utilizing enzyme